MNALPYNPERGGPAARVLDLLARNPEDDYSSADLALKFQVKSMLWPQLLSRPKALDLVVYQAATEDAPKTWAAGPALAAWVAARDPYAKDKPAAAPAAAPAPAKASNASKRGGRRPLLPPLDLDALVVERGVPVAPRQIGQRGDSKWAPVLAKLQQPGDSLALPMSCRAAVYAYTKKAIKAGRLKGSTWCAPAPATSASAAFHARP